jgi:hypothetical protein
MPQKIPDPFGSPPRKKKDRTGDAVRSLDFFAAGTVLQGEQPVRAANICPSGQCCSKLLRGGLSRHRSLLLRGLNVTTTTTAASTAISTTTAAIAAVAAAIATAIAAAVATMMATVASMAAAMATTAIATVAAAVMTKRHHLAVTADEGDSNDREKHRQTKNNDTVHPQILQLLTGTVSENYPFAVTTTQPRQPTAQRRAATEPSRTLASDYPKRSLLSKSTGYEGYEGHKG